MYLFCYFHSLHFILITFVYGFSVFFHFFTYILIVIFYLIFPFYFSIFTFLHIFCNLWFHSFIFILPYTKSNSFIHFSNCCHFIFPIYSILILLYFYFYECIYSHVFFTFHCILFFPLHPNYFQILSNV